ncbi:MAG TPA: ABC transporter permease [Candidatus Limnocylindrales bacterium]|nr:ABC transporter permease [Candidatus Limnocylindrales bacterium]
MPLRGFLLRLRSQFRQSALDRQLEEELRFHLDMEAETNRKRGMKTEEAWSAAQRSFGGTQQIKESYRERRGLPMIEVALKDLRYAFRAIRKSPGFTAIVVISLAVGIGANTAVFTLIDAVMLRSLPVTSPGELVSVGDASRPTALLHGEPMQDVFSYPLYRRLVDENHVFSGLLASGQAGRLEVEAGSGVTEEARGRLVSGNYFQVLGVPPIAGRTFFPDEERGPGSNPVVVISYDYWVNRFGRDPKMPGKTLRINDSTFTVVGVAPPHFSGEVVGSPADMWIPLSMQPVLNPGDARLDSRDTNWLLCIGRLKAGVSIQRARAEMVTLVRNAVVDYENAAGSPHKLQEIRSEQVDVAPGSRGLSWVRKYDSSLLFLLMAMVCLVLLIACANAANLLMARGASRQREISLRMALGAGRARVIRQLLTESALLAAAAGVMGVLLAASGSRLLLQLASVAAGPNQIPFEVDVHPNMTVLGFNAVISVLTAILFGLAPAFRSTHIDIAPALKENARNVSAVRWNWGSVLVVAQLALSVVIVTGAGLFLRSMAHLNSVDVGYSRRNVLVISADLAGSGYPASQRVGVSRRLVEHLNSLPGVAGATVSQNGIFSRLDSSTDVLQVEGFVPARKSDSSSSFDQVGPHYFQVLGVPIEAGREFGERENVSAGIPVVANETMAKFYFGNGDPLGKHLLNGGDRYTVIGVVKDMKERSLKSKTERRFYGPLFQSDDTFRTLNFEVKTFSAAAPMIAAIRREIRSFDPGLKILAIDPVNVLIDQDIGGDRLIAAVSRFFGILVLLLAAYGLYGVISYTTGRRTSEIGLRMAIGADRRDVMRMVLGQTMMLICAGLAIGLPAAMAASRLIASTLAGVSPNDPLTYGAVILVMLAAGLLAGFVPAARASRIDPMAALRQE